MTRKAEFEIKDSPTIKGTAVIKDGTVIGTLLGRPIIETDEVIPGGGRVEFGAFSRHIATLILRVHNIPYMHM